ncbi:predicted nucleotidyltransferase [Candidatus Vecturithrix granuli]|uniref:Predicted nucleotidyltransferase n=1 Tax=Vecturithrix granuli TaxID=1499967 RepID=A0A081BU45_VECG1|nr:predicted nucleotidyltransferase [Candidatus Vecturithrix granuli]
MPDNTIVLQKLKRLLQQHFPDAIRDVILFGSRAKGTAHDDSDYDVLIVLNNNDYDWKFRDEVTDVVYDMELADDILVDKHLISVDELEHSLRGIQPIFRNAIEHGVYA